MAYSYVVRSRRGGEVTNVACSPATITIGAEPEPEPEPPVPGEMSCSVSVNANDVLVVSYSGFTNVSNVQLRRDDGIFDGINDRWIGTGDPGAGDFDDTSAEPGVAYSYVVRSRSGGVVDFACSPATITIAVDEAN